uniref:Ig-like domain-containing protein n=1 Tax=Cyclopterus lumpus TaxID=8103 RepID=A0A8C2XP01_CYCLU
MESDNVAQRKHTFVHFPLKLSKSVNTDPQHYFIDLDMCLPSVSASPSEIVEGSSVTLTCSSDANPAANYTWYKKNQTRPHGEGDIYRFTSISSEDRGIYYCKAQNKHGEINSSSLFLNVQCEYNTSSLYVSDAPRLPSVPQNCVSCPGLLVVTLHSYVHIITSIMCCCSSYSPFLKTGHKDKYLFSLFSSDGPRLPSVSVSPSEIVEGSSVTLTCSSDANPAANYTWYKKNQTGPHGEEPQLVFSSIQSSDSGQYLCKAENHLGKKRSKFISIDVKCE